MRQISGALFYLFVGNMLRDINIKIHSFPNYNENQDNEWKKKNYRKLSGIKNVVLIR